MQTNEFFNSDDYREERAMMAVGHSPSPPTIPSARMNSINDTIIQYENISPENEGIYFTNRKFDPPSKVCGGSVLSKLMSIGNCKHKLKKKNKEQQQDDKCDHSSAIMTTLRSKMTKKKENNVTSNWNNDNGKHQTLIVPESSTMSSISEPTASVSLFRSMSTTTVGEHPSMKNKNLSYELDGGKHTEVMPSLQDIQVLFNEIKILNETVKEISTLKNLKKAKQNDVSPSITCDDDKHRHRNEKDKTEDGENCEESLDEIFMVRSNDDKEDNNTIDKLKRERKFYRSEANNLRSELGGIKEELGELRKFLQQIPTTKNENLIFNPIDIHSHENDRPRLLEDLVQRKSEKTSEMRSDGLSSNNDGKKFPPIGMEEVKRVAPRAKRVGRFHRTYYKHGELFSNLEDGKDKDLHIDQQYQQDPVTLERPIPVYVDKIAKRPSSNIPLAARPDNNTDKRHNLDFHVTKNCPAKSPTLSSAEKTYYDMIYRPEPKNIENQSIGVGHSVGKNYQNDDELKFGNEILCNSEQMNFPNEKNELVPFKKDLTDKVKTELKGFRGRRGISPMRIRSTFIPPSPSMGNINVPNPGIEGKGYRQRSLSQLSDSPIENEHSTGAIASSDHQTMTKHEMKAKHGFGANRDGVAKSGNSMHPKSAEKDSTKESDFEIAKTFYRSFQPICKPDSAKQCEKLSSRSKPSQYAPIRENTCSFTFTDTKNPSHDLKAADREYRELRRSLPQSAKSGNKNNRHNLQKQKAATASSLCKNSSAEDGELQECSAKFGENACSSFTFNDTKILDFDLKAADREYRELRKSLQQQSGNKNNRNNLQKQKAVTELSFCKNLSADDSLLQQVSVRSLPRRSAENWTQGIQRSQSRD